MPQIKCYPNTIEESDIWELFNKIKVRNTYGYFLNSYFENSDMQVIITNEDSIYNEDSEIKDLTTRRGYSTTTPNGMIILKDVLLH